MFDSPQRVESKKDSYALIARRLTGNMLQTWKTLEDAVGADYAGPLRLRYSGTGGNSKFSFVPFPKEELAGQIASWISDGVNPKDIVICEAGPDNSVRIQGEVYFGPCGLELWYSTENGVTCREAMKSPKQAVCIEALGLLRCNMDAASYDDLMTLLKIYPDSVIEFSTFDQSVGWAKRNTVFWEVRNY